MKFKLALFVLFIIVLSNHLSITNNVKNKVLNVKETKLSSETYKCSVNCLKCENNLCLECEKGNFKYLDGCYMSCPFDTLADNYSSSCKQKSEKPVYIKAFTVSRCMNSCGKQFSDCRYIFYLFSCNLKCKKFGNCCSDYKFCKLVEKNHSTKCHIKNCKFCSKKTQNQICLQCDENYYYFNNSCHKRCPDHVSKIMESNKFCKAVSNQGIDKLIIDCSEDNCELCDDNSSKCIKCMNGHFLHKGKCLKTCPINYHADRIKFVCNLKNGKVIFYQRSLFLLDFPI